MNSEERKDTESEDLTSGYESEGPESNKELEYKKFYDRRITKSAHIYYDTWNYTE